MSDQDVLGDGHQRDGYVFFYLHTDLCGQPSERKLTAKQLNVGSSGQVEAIRGRFSEGSNIKAKAMQAEAIPSDL